MSDPVIIADAIGKRYSIGEIQDNFRTLRDALANAAWTPVRAFRSIARKTERRRAGNETIDALKDVSFQIQRGEIVGLIGRNGAGKSTLLKVLSRITEPTEGRIRIRGRVGSLLEVGTGFHPELTGRENIFLNGAILGMKKGEIRRKFDQIVSFAEVDRFIDTPVKHYSSGMYLRLAFAVAAHLEPEILLVDEVLAVGDVAFQNKCLGKMGEIAGEGRTVLFVSHNMLAIKMLCGRALLIDEGRIKRAGSASDVVQYYLMGENTCEKKTWARRERPGNDSFKLNSVRLVDESNAEVSAIKLTETLIVEIDYEVVSPGAMAIFSLLLLNSEGIEVFASVNNGETQFYGKPLECGHYVSRCRIYPNLLNSGRYYITIVGFSGNWTDPFHVDQVVAFDAVDDGVLRRDFFGNYGGFIRPQLDWETFQSLSGSDC